MSIRHGILRVGTSGYQYEHWKGAFYPDNIPKRGWFDHYAAHFDTVEINNTFYHLPDVHIFTAWRQQAPHGFLYALKFSRYGSHIKRLKQPRAAIDRFLEHADALRPLLGPILVQLPPRWNVNVERLAAFLDAAPADHLWCVEFRDPSWLCDEIYSVLEKHRAALCIHDMIDNHPQRMTANWVYLRYHGENYTGGYSTQFLVAEARRIRGYLSEGRDVYAYFNNDAEAHAVRNAADLRRFVEK